MRTGTAACSPSSATPPPSSGTATCGNSGLHLAAANGRTVVCRYLLKDLGYPVDARSTSGHTPLVLAAKYGHAATAACLLELGADPRAAADSDGETPLHWAAYNGTCSHARPR